MSERLENWNDHSVYRNKDGEIIPELLRAMMAIRRYRAAAKAKAQKWEYDL